MKLPDGIEKMTKPKLVALAAELEIPIDETAKVGDVRAQVIAYLRGPGPEDAVNHVLIEGPAHVEGED